MIHTYRSTVLISVTDVTFYPAFVYLENYLRYVQKKNVQVWDMHMGNV